MRSPRPRPARGGRVARAIGSAAALTATLAVTLSACSLSGGGSSGETEPPRLTPEPRPDVATAMVEGRPPVSPRLPACELLDLTTARVIALTGTEMPDVAPVGTGDLSDICTYGGPGSPERFAAAQAEAVANGLAAAGAPTTWPTPTTTAADATSTAATTAPTGTSTTTAVAPAPVPDTVAAAVAKPRGGSAAALAGQADLLGARYACSEVRGPAASGVAGAPPAAAGAPAPVRPELDSAYIDCVARPTGGGIEVHTILIADNDVWHVTVVRPEVPRSAAAEARALEGAHKVAQQILD